LANKQAYKGCPVKNSWRNRLLITELAELLAELLLSRNYQDRELARLVATALAL
jgi:hypothetical protein